MSDTIQCCMEPGTLVDIKIINNRALYTVHDGSMLHELVMEHGAKMQCTSEHCLPVVELSTDMMPRVAMRKVSMIVAGSRLRLDIMTLASLGDISIDKSRIRNLTCQVKIPYDFCSEALSILLPS